MRKIALTRIASDRTTNGQCAGSESSRAIVDIWVGRVRRAHGLLQFELPLSDHIQRSDHIAQRVCRHADSSCEKKERCDDHSDSDESELATSAAFSVFWMRNRKNLDEESDHVATG